MKTFHAISFLLVSIAFSLCAQTAPMFWQTTHTANWHSNGSCILQSNSLRISIDAFEANVEEEATIATTGTVSWGDPATLEIVGQFELTPGTVVRSMLLWNGNKILKAKLKDRTAADSAYEDVVDRDSVRVIPRDPALIENIGLNTYRYKIYPVALNGSRKIRILYSVPLQASNTSPFFELKTAFINGTNQTPAKVSVTIDQNASIFASYIIKYGSIQKTIQFGSNYSIPVTDFYTYYNSIYNPTIQQWVYNVKMPRSIVITMDTTNINRAYAFHCATGNGAGYYTAIFATTPPDFANYVKQLSGNHTYLYELKVNAGTESIIENIPYVGGFSVSIKSSQPWDHNIYWTAYNETGHIAAQRTQTILPDTTSEIAAMAPLFWASKYCFKENSGNLGALYGFVDKQMSLLALESDTLSAALSSQYANKGVPPLLPEEIIIARSKLPVAPDNSVIFEFLSAKANHLDATKIFSVMVQPDGLMMINIGANKSGLVDVKVFDLNGRLVFSKTLTAGNGQMQVKLPGYLKGAFVVKVMSGKEVMQKKIVVR